MSVIYLLLPLSLIFASGAVIAFVWAARGGQFDDLKSPAEAFLAEDSLEERTHGKERNHV